MVINIPKRVFDRVRQLACLFLLALTPYAVTHADTVRLTMYDDGLSCPGGCDAHVVFHKSLNGTEFAHGTGTASAPYEKCKTGELCRVCLESGGKQCFQVRYRGTGPGKMTFDFTPRFYEENCPSSGQFPVLAAMCRQLETGAARLGDATNCIREPGQSRCVALMQEANAAKDKDRIEYDACIAQGQDRYNAGKLPAQRRSHSCAYEYEGTGGPNSRQMTWKRLLPGACRDGTFVGRDGLDCCSGSLLADGPLGRECAAFYPRASDP